MSISSRRVSTGTALFSDALLASSFILLFFVPRVWFEAGFEIEPHGEEEEHKMAQHD
jgi:hypothetical protein